MDLYSEIISNTAMSSNFINTLYMYILYSLFSNTFLSKTVCLAKAKFLSKTSRVGGSGGSRGGSRGSLEPPFELNYFIFMGNFRKNEAKLGKRTPFLNLNPLSRKPGSAPGRNEHF